MMAKRKPKRGSTSQSNKRTKRCQRGVDRISQLTDDILIGILSLLPLKEAASTTILSLRWRNLWKQRSCLNFEDQRALVKIYEDKDKNIDLLKYERRKFVTRVNSVLRSREAFPLKELSVRFDLCKSSRNSINEWLRYAFTHQVERLELNLLKYGNQYRSFYGQYNFCKSIIRQSSGGSSKVQLPSNIICVNNSSFNFKSLKVLSFKGVNVSGEVLEFFLHNCPYLETLRVWHSDDLLNLKVTGPSLKLKHLEILDCNCETLTLCSTNIASLSVIGVPEVLLYNLPALVEVTIEDHLTNLVEHFRTIPSCCLSQLEFLHLGVSNVMAALTLRAFPKLPKLKKLVLVLWSCLNHSLLRVVPCVTAAAPCLQEFELRLRWCTPVRTAVEVQKAEKPPHQFLKVVKIQGYYGRTSDLEIFRFFLENAVALEKIIIDPRPYRSHHIAVEEQVPEVVARNVTEKQLRNEVIPQHIELVIL